MTPLLASLGSLYLGAIRSCLIVFVSLECTWKPCLLHVLLNFSPKPGIYGMTIEMFPDAVVRLSFCMIVVPVVAVFEFKFCCSLFRALLGNSQIIRAFLRCSGSLANPLECWKQLCPYGLVCYIHCFWQ